MKTETLPQSFRSAWLRSNMKTRLDRLGKTDAQAVVRDDTFRFIVLCIDSREKKHSRKRKFERARKMKSKGYRVFLVRRNDSTRFPQVFSAVTQWKTEFWAAQIVKRTLLK